MATWKTFVRIQDPRLPIKHRRVSLLNYGPAFLGLRTVLDYAEGPEQFVRDNPGLFATGTTSRDEGYGYWALLKKIGKEREPGKNGMTWYYQSKTGEKGGSFATVDFVVENGARTIGIRVVTPWFHLQAGPSKRAFDQEQIVFLLDQGVDVVDVYSQNYVNDRTGRSVIKVFTNAMDDIPDHLSTTRHYR
jgi:hypothetical protein